LSKRKGKEEYLYSAILYRISTELGLQSVSLRSAGLEYLKVLRNGSLQFYLQIHLLFLRKRSPDGTTANSGRRHPIAAYYSSIDPEAIKGWVGLVG